MGYTFDWIVSDLKCLNCGNTSRVDISTYLRDKPNLEELEVGSYIGENLSELQQDFTFYKIQEPVNEIQILNPWTCPCCGSLQWAKITIKKGVLADLISVPLNKSELFSANYISGDSAWLMEDLANITASDARERGLVKTLSEYLP
jgi:hypothetical protein